MAINREFNWLGQARVDVSHLKMVESAVRYDFDVLGYMLSGEAPFVVRGFGLVSSPLNQHAKTITIKTAGSLAIHPLATESGSFFAVPSNRPNEILDPTLSSRLVGACQPNSVNYIGIDLKRRADSTTADLVQFLNPSANLETGQKVPLARTLDYVFVISQSEFTYNQSILPIAIVTTNETNTVTAFQDARPMWCRLTPGGTVGSAINPYSWPGGRTESATSMVAGDKSLTSLKAWQNAIMTRLWEIGGGEQWYSPTADRNVQLHTGTAVFASTGESFEAANGHLHWQGLSFGFDNSTQYSVTVADQTTDQAGLTDLASGDCIYVDLNRASSSPVSVQKGTLKTLGLGQNPGSRWVIASRIGNKYYVKDQPWPVGWSASLATTTHAGVLKTSLDVPAANPIAATMIPVTNPDAASYGMVAGRGISHCHLSAAGGALSPELANPSDISVGKGESQGDLNVDIRTTGDYCTTVSGDGTTRPILRVLPNSMSSVDITPLTTPFSIGDVFVVEGTRAQEIKAVDFLPVSPSSTNGAWCKQFLKRSRTFREEVRVALLDASGHTLTYDDETKTLTFDTDDALGIDSVELALNDRVLVNIPGQTYNGLFKATDLGGGHPAVLTRTDDGGGLLSVSYLGKGYDLFDGVSVKVTAGGWHANKMFGIAAVNKNNAVDLSGATVWVWTEIADSLTREEVCVMFRDGSWSVICSGPLYSYYT